MHKSLNTRMKKKGFTLSELLLAVAILAFALTSLLAEFFACFLLNEANRNLTTAVTHAQFVMEDIRDENVLATIRNNIDTGLWDWDTDLEFTNNGLERLSGEAIDACCYNTGNGTCETNCPGLDLLPIRVRVDWQDRGPRNRNITFETLVAEP
ncbi:MAG: prepilin-type N-terminal cleavage/methylation domain-containing protein [Candidatus Omnitrophota bacterium]|nr:MAG: prepilin-type N-terminal cleavage/methylation domain-containing protein [Candidatus Omnitrophota bacterium]